MLDQPTCAMVLNVPPPRTDDHEHAGAPSKAMRDHAVVIVRRTAVIAGSWTSKHLRCTPSGIELSERERVSGGGGENVCVRVHRCGKDSEEASAHEDSCGVHRRGTHVHNDHGACVCSRIQSYSRAGLCPRPRQSKPLCCGPRDGAPVRHQPRLRRRSQCWPLAAAWQGPTWWLFWLAAQQCEPNAY